MNTTAEGVPMGCAFSETLFYEAGLAGSEHLCIGHGGESQRADMGDAVMSNESRRAGQRENKRKTSIENF